MGPVQSRNRDEDRQQVKLGLSGRTWSKQVTDGSQGREQLAIAFAPPSRPGNTHVCLGHATKVQATTEPCSLDTDNQHPQKIQIWG